MTTVQQLAQSVGERIYDRLAREARRAERIPGHVQGVYRWNPLRDVFLDQRGRLWYAETAELRAQLPPDPEKYDRIPPQFWHPSARTRRQREQHEDQKWARDIERAELELVRD